MVPCGSAVPRTVYVLFLFYLQCTLVNKLLMHNAINYLQLPEVGKKWGFLIWLLFSYCGLFCIACMSLGKVSSGLLLPVICFYSLFLCAKSFCLACHVFLVSEQPINRKFLQDTILLRCFISRLALLSLWFV